VQLSTAMFTIAVIGGGAAGFFAAIAAAEKHPHARVVLFERTNTLLAKVRISGGGRCNVTHSCFDPKKLISYYPRGSKELLGPFTQFQPKDTIEWFESRAVPLKTEVDGRVFPVSNNSQSIIDCLFLEAKKKNVEIRLQSRIEKIEKGFVITLSSNETFSCDRLLLATGGSAQGHALAQALGHKIIPPVPSLFTFNVPDSPLKELSGIVVEKVSLKITGTALVEKGPLLITHFGFSGPAVLRLSAWGARILHEKDYRADLIINWVPESHVKETLLEMKKSFPKSTLGNVNPFLLPRNLWKKISEPFEKRLADLSHKEIEGICEKLEKDTYSISGKTTNKEEFVTAGGIDLKEVNFKTMESRICSGLFFAGEILDIDGITGGFNFQNAWTTAWIASSLFLKSSTKSPC